MDPVTPESAAAEASPPPLAPKRPMLCGACGAEMAAGTRFCEACGRDQLGPDPADEARMVDRLRKARGWILAVGILYLVNLGIIWFQVRHALFLPMVKGWLIAIAALALFQFGLWWWARREPFAAAVVALAAFVTLQTVQVVIEPKSLLSGIIIKVLFIVALVQAVSAGLAVRRMRAEAARTPTAA